MYQSSSSYNFDETTGVQVSENGREIDSTFLFTGSKDLIQRNISRFIENIKSSIIESCSFFYKVNFNGSAKPDVFTNNSVKLSLKLDLKDVYETEKSIQINTTNTININSPKVCDAILEVSSQTNVIKCTISINSKEILIKNIKGGEPIYIGDGKIISNNTSKIGDVELWEFPILYPGYNYISVDREDVNLTIRYCERW
ncbi:hypothetical protein QJS64_19410 (plasmid) [Paraclostridium bifermentans]|uniref:Phage tail protein n=1 Tax=Paraclostridium bifermentans TaxID=1490 RepID=A0ABY8R747_PARBF|nr:hypothetical protein QJS64_19410 [Paraclostridium bifermentans]